MHRRTRFLATMGVALITAGILQITLGDKYRSNIERHCHFAWRHHKVMPDGRPGESFKN